MILAALFGHGNSDPELVVGILAVTTLACFGLWALVKRMLLEPAPPDPWDSDVATEIRMEGATQLCHRCLTAHDSAADFCPACGAPVGQYTNWLPYPYLFSVGHALRIGTSGEFRRSPLTVFGFMLFSLVEYTLFAPIYWVLMLRKLGKAPEQDVPHLQSSPRSGESKT